MRRATPLKKTSVDPAREVEISFQLKYTECDLAEERFENHPVLQLFYSNHFIRSRAGGGVLSIPLDEHHLNKVYSGKLKATLSRKHTGIPERAAIGIDSYALHREKHGHPCFVNVGTTHAYMGDLVREVKANGYYDHQHDLLMRTTIFGGGEQVKKGIIEFKVTKIELGPSVNGLDTTASPLSAPVAQIESELTTYIQTTMNFEMQLPDLLDGTSRIRAPMDVSQVGIESTGGAFLPIAAFAMIEVPESNPDYFRNSFENILKRRRMHRSAFKGLSDHEKCRMMGLLVSYGIQSFDYIGDSVEKTNRHNRFIERIQEGTEEFSNIWTSLAGDCEDSAMGIYTQLKAFQKARFDQKTDPELVEMQHIASEYSPFLTLAVVHGQKIGDHEGRGAHMYLPLLPKHQVRACLERTAAGRQLLARSKPAAPRQLNPFMGKEADSVEDLMQRRPALFCEGTGHIDPLGYDDPIFDQRKYVAMNLPSMEGFKKEIPHQERAPSSFYLANLLGVNADFIEEGINVGAFVYGTVNPQYDPNDASNAHEMCRGVLYTDMLKGSEKMAFMPQPIMAASTMSIIREANALNPPARPLILDKSKPMAGEDCHPVLESFVRHVKSLGRVGKRHPSMPSVDVFIRPAQLDDHIVSMMQQDATSAPRLVDADYVKEMVTNHIYLYRLQLFIQ